MEIDALNNLLKWFMDSKIQYYKRACTNTEVTLHKTNIYIQTIFVWKEITLRNEQLMKHGCTKLQVSI